MRLRHNVPQHQYNTSGTSPASSPRSPNRWPEDAAHASRQGYGVDIQNIWHQYTTQQNPDFQLFSATGAVSPQSNRHGHLIGPVPDIRVIPEQSEHASARQNFLVTSTASQAAAPQAYITSLTSTSAQAILGAPQSPQHSTTGFIDQFTFPPSTRSMGSFTKPVMKQHGHTRTEPSPSEEPASKRRRISMASDHASIASANMQEEQEHEDTTSPALSDSISPHGFSPRRGYTFKRDGEPPRNSEGKMICQADPSCKHLTFDRKCEWG